MKILKSLYEILTVCHISYLLLVLFSKLDQKVQKDGQHQILTSYPTIVRSDIHEPINKQFQERGLGSQSSSDLVWRNIDGSFNERRYPNSYISNE